MQYHLIKLSNNKNIAPETMRTVTDDLEAIREKQKLSYLTN